MYKKGDLVEVISASETDEFLNIYNGMIGEVVRIRSIGEVQINFYLGNDLCYSFYPMYIEQIKPYTPK